MSGLFDDGRVWTCAKGSYAEPVAEHALALALAGLRQLPADHREDVGEGRAPASTTPTSPSSAAAGSRVAARAAGPVPGPGDGRAPAGRARPGAARTIPTVAARGPARRPGRVPGPRPHPRDHRDHRQGRAGAHGPGAWLVNVARGRHVVTYDLVDALRGGVIAGAALDVTDPEPLPDGHPLWDLPNAIITPHTADWPEVVTELLARRIATNVSRFAAGEPLEGLVDPDAGYCSALKPASRYDDARPPRPSEEDERCQG